MQTLFEWLSNPSFSALAAALLASLWQAGLVFIVVYALLRLNSQAPARIKFNIAAIGQLIIACWFTQTFLHQFSLQQTLSQSLTAREAAMPFYLGQLPLLSGLYTDDIARQGFQTSRLLPMALSVYIIGVFVMAVRIAIAYRHTRVLKTKGLCTPPAPYINHLRQICRQLHIYNNIKLYLSNRVSIPIMMGFVKPVILLPVSIASHLTMTQIEAIITHELAHIRRQDYLINFILSVIEALFFFNPFIWLLSKIMREEREKACDELVVRAVPAYTYATALLALEKINGTKRLTLAVNGHKPFKLLNRIKLFTMNQNPIMTVRQKALSVLLIVVGLGCIAWLSPDKSVQQTQKQQVTREIPPDPAPETNDNFPLLTDTAFPQRNKHIVYKDSLSPELKKQVDEITRSAKEITDKLTRDSSWKEATRAIQLSAEKMALKFEQDTAWKKNVEKITADAKALSRKMKEDPAYKKQLQDMDNLAGKISKDYQPSVELQKQIEDIRKKSLAMALQFQQDSSWKNQLKNIQFKAKALAHQMQDNPEMARKIQELTARSKEIIFKALNDPKLKEQIEKLKSDIEKMKFMNEDRD